MLTQISPEIGAHTQRRHDDHVLAARHERKPACARLRPLDRSDARARRSTSHGEGWRPRASRSDLPRLPEPQGSVAQDDVQIELRQDHSIG